MGIAKALTNDLERAVRMYRLPILTAIALSLRRTVDDRFLLTDDQNEDSRRNVVSLRKVTVIEQNTTKPGVGVDDRQFTPLTGNLLFTGLPGTDGQVQPIYNLSNMGGSLDLNDVHFFSTGTVTDKAEKAARLNRQYPGDVSWRVRTPVMMAEETSTIDYLAFRCTQLPFLHSISIKWSDRRWDARSVSLDQDLYRPVNEKSHMVTLSPLWMDRDMRSLNPDVWGPYESLLRANYEEALGRKFDEQAADCAAFTETYKQYRTLLQDIEHPSPATDIGRVSRLLNITANRTLYIPFNRHVDNHGENVGYKVSAADPATSQDVTQDVFNLKDAQGHWRLTSSFEGGFLSDDGWCGEADTMVSSTDIPADLPPYTTEKDGTPVFGSKSLRVVNGFVCRRLVLPNGLYALRLWVKNPDKAQVEVIKNNRFRTKTWTMNGASRVTNISHFRENYETVATAALHPEAEWRQVTVSFALQDSFQVAGEGYPAHEVYLVCEAENVALFDHVELFQDRFGHEVRVLNTVNLSAQPFEVRPELRHVNLEKAFQDDQPFGVREVAAASMRLDGREMVVRVTTRDAYNVNPSGTTIDGWFKVNSDDEASNNVLTNRGSFTLFQKTGTYLPGYACTVNRERVMRMTVGEKQAFISTNFRNTMLHPSVGTAVFEPRVDWANPNIYDTFKTAFKETGEQPVEWTDLDGTATAVVGTPRDIGGGKFLLVSADDPYLIDNPGTIHVLAYLNWHATRAYSQIMPVEQVSPGGMNGGFVFAPIPINPLLREVSVEYGHYNPSPDEWNPRYLHSPMVRVHFPSPGDLHPPPSVIFTHGNPPPPGTVPLEQIHWPVSPGQWGQQPVPWPGDSALYGPTPTFSPFSWNELYNDADMNIRHPMFIKGALRFDRWMHLNVTVGQTNVEATIHGVPVYVADPGVWDLPANTGKNGNDLIIGASVVNALRVAAPISLYGFKIFQTFMPLADRQSIFSNEAVNFNELQYNVYADNLDFDLDRQLDFWQDDITDFGLWTKWPNGNPDPYRIYPEHIQDHFGKVQPSVPDPITIATDTDRNKSLIADWFDESYLAELIDTQTIGAKDGLIFWDFAHADQAATYDYKDRYYDPDCQTYRDRTLSYLDWLNTVLAEEWNSVNAIHDPIPGIATAGSPAASGHPVFGDAANELVMTGVKGRFGFNGLVGYRDSLAQVAKESIVFNYLQIELHFRAPRTELEALLKPYAHSIDQIYDDDYRGNHLTKQGNR